MIFICWDSEGFITRRQAFPCWDEPAVKATFDLTVTAPADRVVLSNMPELSNVTSSQDSSLKTVTFETTPIMSTYLVAIVVGNFQFCFFLIGILSYIGLVEQLDTCTVRAVDLHRSRIGIWGPVASGILGTNLVQAFLITLFF